MSVLIKSMKMPKGRRGVFVCVCPDGTAIIQDDEVIQTTAVELPPHGRLIDADKLIRNFQATADDEWNKNCGATWSTGFLEAINMTEDAPTVIEAEESES